MTIVEAARAVTIADRVAARRRPPREVARRRQRDAFPVVRSSRRETGRLALISGAGSRSPRICDQLASREEPVPRRVGEAGAGPEAAGPPTARLRTGPVGRWREPLLRLSRSWRRVTDGGDDAPELSGIKQSPSSKPHDLFHSPVQKRRRELKRW